MKLQIIFVHAQPWSGVHLARADAPDSGYHGMPGPNVVRFLVEIEPRMEFLVRMDSKRVEIRFIGDAFMV